MEAYTSALKRFLSEYVSLHPYIAAVAMGS